MNNLFNDRIDFGFSKGRPANYSKHDYFGGKGQEHIQLFRNNLNDICDLYLNEKTKYEEQDIVLPPFAGQLAPAVVPLQQLYRRDTGHRQKNELLPLADTRPRHPQ
ncbi:hypothetical protein ACQ86N_03970 [Puia sp. P3]|uniref:hypothetical protein n=1 Tax=Puia sp. P3 TaxID=3423952 RepID=UPI003D6755BE